MTYKRPLYDPEHMPSALYLQNQGGMLSQVDGESSSQHPPNNMSTCHYAIQPYIAKKMNTSTPVLNLLESYFSHLQLRKKYSYIWLEKAVEVFTLKMVQVLNQFHHV